MKTGKLWQLSTVTIKSGIEGGFLQKGGEGRGFGLKKQLKVNNWWNCNKLGEWD